MTSPRTGSQNFGNATPGQPAAVGRPRRKQSSATESKKISAESLEKRNPDMGRVARRSDRGQPPNTMCRAECQIRAVRADERAWGVGHGNGQRRPAEREPAPGGSAVGAGQGCRWSLARRGSKSGPLIMIELITCNG